MNNKTRIEHIVKFFKEEFPLNWIDKYNWQSDNINTSIEKCGSKIYAFEHKAFYLFAQSVLSGEYIVRYDYSSQLDSLYELLSNGELLDDDLNPLKSLLIQQFNSLTYEWAYVIRSMRHLITMLNNKYAESHTNYIVNAYRSKRNRNRNGSLAKYCDILIDITRIDHFLSYDRKTITSLIIDHEELNNGLQNKALSEDVLLALHILSEKCLFLLKKLLIEDNKEFDFMIDFEKKHVDASKIAFKSFSKMNDYFDFYRTEVYSDEHFANYLDKKASKKTLQIGKYSLLMKYYKDSKNTIITQINNILRDFNTKYDEEYARLTKRPLDIYALNTLKNYMYNSRFSFLMKRADYSFEQLQNDLQEIIEVQYSTGVFNFYPYRKAFNKALELFHSKSNISEEESNKYKVFLQLCISRFAESIKWCRENNFYPIQNVYKECLIKERDFGVIFIASSYCRPVKYEKLFDELSTFKNQALLVDNEIALNSEKQQLKDLREELKHSRTKEIEILSAFTAIITFLFGTIGFFADNKDADFIHLIFSTLGLGAILLIFISGIYLVTMRKEKKLGDYFTHPRAWFCVITILASFSFLFWLVAKIRLL